MLQDNALKYFFLQDGLGGERSVQNRRVCLQVSSTEKNRTKNLKLQKQVEMFGISDKVIYYNRSFFSGPALVHISTQQGSQENWSVLPSSEYLHDLNHLEDYHSSIVSNLVIIIRCWSLWRLPSFSTTCFSPALVKPLFSCFSPVLIANVRS